MKTHNTTSSNDRINVFDSYDRRTFRTCKTKMSKFKQTKNSLPVLALSRCTDVKPLIDFKPDYDPSYQGQYFWIKSNLLPRPSKLGASNVGKSIRIPLPVTANEPNIQAFPDVIFTLVDSKKVEKNEITEKVNKIILPTPEDNKILPATVEVISSDNTSIENSKAFKQTEILTQSGNCLEVMDLDYLLDKEVLDLNEIMLLSQLNLTFLVEHLIPEGTITILAGPSDTGKSTFALQIATCIIQDKPEVIGKRLTVKHKRVIYISTEDGPNHLGNKLKKQLGPTTKDLPGDQFRIVQTMAHLEAELQKWKVDLVIIDTLTDFFKGEINSATAIRQFFNDQIKPLMKKYGFTCLILHHIGKNKSKVAHKDQLVGSQSIEAAARQVLYLVEGKKSQKILKIVKGNYVPNEVKKEENILELDPEKLLFRVVERNVGEVNSLSGRNLYANLAEIDKPAPVVKRRNAPSKAKIEKALELDSKGYTLEQMAKELGVKSASTVRNWLKKEKGSNYNRKKI